jgi:hypothetical protein
MTEEGKQKELAPVEKAEVIAREQPDMAELFHLAIEKGPEGAETLDKLMGLYERIEDRRAAADFNDAMARFQAECPPIPRSRTAQITRQGGTGFSYTYAELDDITRAIRPVLHKVGLSYSWDSTVEGTTLTCICTLRHVNGHKETATFASPTESKAGMSDQQKVASALTYARRQSLVQVLGLTTCDDDTDGASTEKITEKQAQDLEALLASVGGNRKRFLVYMKVENIADILANDYQIAVNAIEAKRE